MNTKLRKIVLGIEGQLLKLKRGKDVLFVIRNELMFDYALPIYQILKKEPGVRCWFCYFDRFQFKNLKLLQKEFPLRWISYRWAEVIKWDLVIMPDQGPYIRKDIPKIYSDHGVPTGKMVKGHPYVFGPKSLDEKGEIIYQKIFTPSHFMAERIRRLYPSFSSRLRVTGNLLSDELLTYREHRRLEDLRRLHFREDRKTIMLASTWGPHSMFQYLDYGFRKAVESISPFYNVIISLHFLNYVQRSYEGFKGLIVEDIFRDIPKGVYITGPSESGNRYLPLADLLVTDHTSLGLYFPVLRRPIIFYDNPEMVYSPHSLIYDLRKAAYNVKDLSNLTWDIEQCFETFDEIKMRLLSEKIFSYPGRAAKRYKEEIFDSLGLKNEGHLEGAVL